MPTSSKFTTARMKKVSKRLNGIYKQASEELAEKVNSFFADFERLDKQKIKLVESGKMSEHEYEEWRKNKLLMGKKYEDLRDTMVERMTKADEIATAYMNGELPAVYAHNFNQVGKDAEAIVKGYSFDLVNEDAVRKLSTSDKTLLPYKIVDGRRTERWHTKRVNSAILQGILQGEGSKKIAKRLMETTEMGKVSAMRNARTALTGAQNKGREDAMGRLAKAGLPIRKKWMASTGDGRTRDAHLELHGVSVPWGKPFENSIGRIMYPGDPNAHPSNTYNCRCSMITDFSEVLKEQGEEQEQEKQEEHGVDIEQLRSAAEGAQNKVEFWMNMSEEQQAIFNASGLSIDDAFNMFKSDEPISEWKKASPGDATSFALSHDFSGNSVRFRKIKAKSEGWMADADELGVINIREDGLGETWDFIIGHESGHQLSNMFPELQSMIMTNPGDVLGRYNTRLMKFVGVYGEYNPEEAFATCVSNYVRHPKAMKEKYPEAYSAIDNLFKASPSAEQFVLDTMNAYKKEFVL